MEKVENGKFVSVNYKGTLQNGEVFNTSSGRQPLEVQVGAGKVIKGFEEGQEIPANIVQVDNENVTADMNHSLAGEVLHFEIELVDISNTPTQAPDECGQGCDCSSCGCS
jgi:peptidylprolyl isomerase